MATKNRILGLFIGVDRYLHVSDLGGCVKDIQKVMSFLASQNHFGLQMEAKTLFNEEATKDNIVKTFHEFLLPQAGPNDFVLIYFSGHGAQEKADPVWGKEEADLGLEGIACHDTGFTPDAATLLGDKEWRFMISQLAERDCEILTVFDCCHSGDATRSNLVPRRLTGALPMRRWDQFIFGSQISPQDISSVGWSNLVPEGRHIQLAACADMELAYENQFGGVFTHHLLKVLEESNGQVSYFDLQSRVKFAIKGMEGGTTQTPQAHAAYGYERDLFRYFMGEDSGSSLTYGNIAYNVARKQWILDRGELHGVIQGKSLEEENLLFIPLRDKSPIVGRIKESSPGFSIIQFEENSEVDPAKTYVGFVGGLFSHELKITAAGHKRTYDAVKQYFKKNEDKLRWQNLIWVDTDVEADYVIREAEVQNVSGEKDHYLQITLPQDERPLAKQMKGLSSETVIETMINDLIVLTKWEFLSRLRNKDEHALPEDAVVISISQRNGTEMVNPGKMLLPADMSTDKFAFNGKAKPFNEISVSLKNNFSHPLYVACVYMGGYRQQETHTVFALKPSILKPEVTRLEPGETAFLLSGDPIPFIMDAYTVQFNWPYQEIGFKVMASMDDFDIQTMEMDGILAPVLPYPDRGLDRPLTFHNPKSAVSNKDWQAWTHWVGLENPYFEQ
ncbi:MAG: caspase family protein [Bacteroidota bacterium]